MGQPTVNDPPYNAIGDGVADDTSKIQLALDDGFCLLKGNSDYRVTSTLTMPFNSTLRGYGARSSRIVADNVTGAVLVNEFGGTGYLGRQEIRDFMITGVADTAISLDTANGLFVDNINIGAGSGNPGSFGTFTDGMLVREVFSSRFANISTIGSVISNFCFKFAGFINANTIDNLQTANICAANVVVGSNTENANAGTFFSNIVCQGGSIGLQLDTIAGGIVFSGIYTENTVLPIRIGQPGQQFAVIATKLSGLHLAGPNTGHPDYALRGPAIAINSVTAITIENVLFASYDSLVTPTLDGIQFTDISNSVISCLHAPQGLFAPKEQLIKRTVDGEELAGFFLDSTDTATRQTYVMRTTVTGPPFEFQRCSASATGMSTESYFFDFSVVPPVGADRLTQHADVTAYAINDFVYVGTAVTAGNVYRCVTSGTSGTGTPPTGTGTGIIDGSVVWDFHGVLV